MRVTQIFGLACALVLVLFSNFAYTSDKPFHRAIIFPGGDFQFPVYLGVLQAAKEKGLDPDLILAGCGGTLAAALVQAIPDPVERVQFVLSEQYYGLLKTVHINENLESLGKAFGQVWEILTTNWTAKVPDIFSNFFINIPFKFDMPQLNRPFSTEGTAVIMTAGHVLFRPEDTGKDAYSPLYREALFTDVKTASYLNGVQSPVGTMYPESYIAKDAEVFTQYDLMTAGRAAIADPFEMNPLEVDGNYFTGGGFDLHPIEIAESIADETIMIFSESFGELLGAPTVKAAYGYDIRDRVPRVNEHDAAYWVDFSDKREEVDGPYGFGLKVSLFKFNVSLKIPDTYEEFHKRVLAQLQYGYDRGAEAFKGPKNGRQQLRNTDTGNMTQEMLVRTGHYRPADDN